MRTYAYSRVDNKSDKVIFNTKYISNMGYEIPSKRVILEEVEIVIGLKHRDKFINLVNHAMESGDLLIVSGIDSLGSNFNEVFLSVNLIFNKKIRLICLEFSKIEISGEIKGIFLHFLNICSVFEGKFSSSRKNKFNKEKKRAGRPEILNEIQKKEALGMYKRGFSVSYIAKFYSVTRTVIQRLIVKSSTTINVNSN